MRRHGLGFFDKLKNKAKSVASDAVSSAVDAAKDAAKDQVTDAVSGAAQNAVDGTLGKLGVNPDGSPVAGAIQSVANTAVDSGGSGAVDAATQKGPGAEESGLRASGRCVGWTMGRTMPEASRALPWSVGVCHRVCHRGRGR